MNKKYIIFIGAGNSQMPLISRVKKRGYNIIVIDRNATAPGFILSDIRIVISTYDTDSILFELEILNKKCDFIAVVARASGPALNTAAAISEKYNLPGLSKSIVSLATEKSKLREFCEENNIKMPLGQKIKTSDNYKLNLEFPVIVKPDLPIIGKKDVRVIRDQSDFNLALKSAINSSGNEYAEVEEYIDGFDIACLFHLKNSKANIVSYWDELVGINKDGFVVGLGVSVPSVIDKTRIKNDVIKIVNCISEKFVNVNAVVILALRIDFNSCQPYVIELHCDLSGDLIADVLLPSANNSIDYFESCLDVALANKNDFVLPDLSPTAIIYNNKYCNVKNNNLNVNLLKANSLLDLHKNIDTMFNDSLFYDKQKTKHYKYLKKGKIDE